MHLYEISSHVSVLFIKNNFPIEIFLCGAVKKFCVKVTRASSSIFEKSVVADYGFPAVNRVLQQQKLETGR